MSQRTSSSEVLNRNKKMLTYFVQERSRRSAGVDDGLKKIECLRGRLLAERQASKIAKQNAESITDKLTELEKQLREETKLRDRAEKKLKFLKQKLEDSVQVQVSVSLPGSEESSSVSENSLGSCESPKIIVENNVVVVEASKSDHTQDLKSTEDCLESRNRAISEESLVENRHPGDENVKTDEQSCSSEVVSEDQHDVDNSLALVPITNPGIEKTKELVITDQSVAEVLEALRLAREGIEDTLRQRRHMISVGPTPTQPQIC